MADRQRARARSIATPEEVLEAFTAMLRGENGEKPAEQLRAAEQLARHYGILAPRDERAAPDAAIAGKIDAALAALEASDDG